MNLMSLLPQDYLRSPAMVELQKAIEWAGTEMEVDIDDLCNQLFLGTATWGLSLWEKMFDVKTDLSKSYEFRRAAVRAKMMGTGTTTVELIKNVAESFLGGEVRVVEQNSAYKFQIIMETIIGIPPNVEDLKRSIEEIKPAHLTFEIIFKYNTNKDLCRYTHGQLSQYRHWELKERELV
nr:MAG TPA: tail protein [Caudoviricetes sp.]